MSTRVKGLQVINKETGEIYKSINYLAKKLGVHTRTLYSKLLNKTKNNTIYELKDVYKKLSHRSEERDKIREGIILDPEFEYLKSDIGNMSVVPQGRSYRIWLKKQKMYLHRYILNLGPYIAIDHINRNPLDNRKENLRILSAQENAWNTSPHFDSKYSKYKGVTYWNNISGRKKRWQTQFFINGKMYKKYFKTEKIAALQYNIWAKEYHKQLAVLNEVEEMSNFEKDLEMGKIGELTLKSIVPSLEQTYGLKYDFITTKGKTVEVKFDQTKYKNIFLEIISNDNKQSPGGPLQSIVNNVNYYVYLFKTGAVFVFDTAKLVEWINNNKNKYDLKKVPNKYYNTIGIAVPISELKHLDLGLEVLK